MSDWELPWEGGCRCSKLRFRVTSPPLLTGACHCVSCQKMSASAYSLTVSLPAEGFELTEGEPVIGGLHGATARHHHCDWCKSWVYTRVSLPGFDLVNLRATMLDDASWFEPYVEFWTADRLPWAITPATHSFTTDPEMEAYQPLTAEFAERGARPGRARHYARPVLV